MLRRTFFRRLFSSLGVTVAGPEATAGASSVLIQESPIAGFQFHEGETAWSSLAVGKELVLAREADNPYDPNAVAVYHGNTQLGYIPRGENNAIAQMMDRGENLSARICRLTEDEDPWKRVRVTIEFS